MTTLTIAPVLQVFYDGACPLCGREVRHYQRRDSERRIEWIDIAQPQFDASSFGLDSARVQQVMHARTNDGSTHTEVAAFVKIWETLPRALPTAILRAILKIPGMMALAGVMYRLFARNRYRLTGRCTHDTCDTSTKT